MADNKTKVYLIDNAQLMTEFDYEKMVVSTYRHLHLVVKKNYGGNVRWDTLGRLLFQKDFMVNHVHIVQAKKHGKVTTI